QAIALHTNRTRTFATVDHRTEGDALDFGQMREEVRAVTSPFDENCTGVCPQRFEFHAADFFADRSPSLGCANPWIHGAVHGGKDAPRKVCLKRSAHSPAVLNSTLLKQNRRLQSATSNDNTRRIDAKRAMTLPIVVVDHASFHSDGAVSVREDTFDSGADVERQSRARG